MGRRAREEIRDAIFPPHNDPKQRGLLHLSLSFCRVLLPQGGWEKGEGGSFRNDVHFFTALHRRAGAEQVCPSEQTVAGGILSWGEHEAHFFAHPGHGHSRYSPYPGP